MVDNALQDEDTYYVDRLNLDELARVITNALRLRQSMILEGICLRDIISQVLPRSAVLFIYVKALSGEGIWHGGARFKDYEPFGPEPDFSDHRYHKKASLMGVQILPMSVRKDSIPAIVLAKSCFEQYLNPDAVVQAD